MPPEIGRGLLENVRLSGRNVGASMIGGGGSSESPGSCSINIYINNDIQGINNSVLIGSELKMGDPGASLCLEGLRMDRGFRLVSKKEEKDPTAYWILILAAFLIPIISFSAYLMA
ncbi:hypothetical protein CDL12_08861 [Handroanthus impetiginosus]|uniref:Uncharacterized protein n=1 Tax=Handroanthus impetiginosus TaxID=429701 RepID=A0A2G9HLR8_9LAMI|nr:hypothetical protein CDL12_08861 [Handroanthus impetiginosus]